MSNKIECRLERVLLDRDGYDACGAYYGVGQKVWRVTYDGPCAPTHSQHEFRSSDLQCARAYVRAAVELHGFTNNLDEPPVAVFVR